MFREGNPRVKLDFSAKLRTKCSKLVDCYTEGILSTSAVNPLWWREKWKKKCYTGLFKI